MDNNKTGKEAVYLISLDLESTGLNMNINSGDKCDSICQIAADVQRVTLSSSDQKCSPEEPEEEKGTTNSKRVTSWESVDQFVTYVKPLKPMSKGASQVTGITDEMLSGAQNFVQVFHRFTEFLDRTCVDGNRVLMAYNGKGFDFKMMFIDLQRCLQQFAPDQDAKKLVLRLKLDFLFDPLILARSHLDRQRLIHNRNGNCSFKLGDVYMSMFSKKLDGAHDALFDCIAVNEVLKHELFEPHLRKELLEKIMFHDDKKSERDSSGGNAEEGRRDEMVKETDFMLSPMRFFGDLAKAMALKRQLPSVSERMAMKLKKSHAMRGSKKRKRSSSPVDAGLGTDESSKVTLSVSSQEQSSEREKEKETEKTGSTFRFTEVSHEPHEKGREKEVKRRKVQGEGGDG